MENTRHIRTRRTIVILWLFCMSFGSGSQAMAGDAILSWNPNADSDLGGYKVYYRTESGSYGTPVTVGNSTTYTVTGLGFGTYYFAVTAFNTAGIESAMSSEVSKTFVSTPSDTIPPQIADVTVASLGDISAVITWNTDETATSQVEYGITSSYGSSTALGSTLVMNHSRTVSGLVPGTTYFYRVRSTDGAGNTALSGQFVFTTPASTDTTAPSDVVGFTAKPRSRMVGLSWTNPSDDDFAGVALRYRTDGIYPVTETDGFPVGDFPGTPDEFVKTNHTGLENKVTYYYSAFTYDTHGNYSRTAHTFATPDEGLDASIDAPSGGGGCGMIRPSGNRPGPWQAADMVALLGLLLIRLLWRGRLRPPCPQQPLSL